jgi:hypothetical protein
VVRAPVPRDRDRRLRGRDVRAHGDDGHQVATLLAIAEVKADLISTIGHGTPVVVMGHHIEQGISLVEGNIAAVRRLLETAQPSQMDLWLDKCEEYMRESVGVGQPVRATDVLNNVRVPREKGDRTPNREELRQALSRDERFRVSKIAGHRGWNVELL